jgi:cytochrome c oxidase subunit II
VDLMKLPTALVAVFGAWLASPLAARPLQHAIAPAGLEAANIMTLWHLLLAVCTLVFVAVLLAFVWALLRSPHADADTPPDLTSLAQTNRRAQRAATAAVVVSVVLLLVLITASIVTERALARLPAVDAPQVQAVPRQW